MKYTGSKFPLFVFLFVGLSLVGCESEGGEAEDGDDYGETDADADSDSDSDADSDADSDTAYLDPTFAGDVAPLINADCTGCHGGTWDDYNSVHNYVNTSSPSSSLIIQNPTGHNGHSQIWSPSGSEASTVLAWIEAGALNN